MADPLRTSDSLVPLPAAASRGRPLTGLLIDQGTLGAAGALEALTEATMTGAPLDRIIAARPDVARSDVVRAAASRAGILALDPDLTPPDDTLADLLPPEICLAHRAIPWATLGDTLIVATARPEHLDHVRAALSDRYPRIMPALADEGAIETLIATRHGATLALRAETVLPADESCRDLNLSNPRTRAVAAIFASGVIAAFAFAPTAFFMALLALAICATLLGQGLKLAALCASPKATQPRRRSVFDPAPVVSLLVPLFHEADIAHSLLRRLGRLTYPKAALDVLLILEAEDDETRSTLAQTPLPHWIRVIEVPPGSVTTKPRALNYALGFARGDIVGVIDAEDAPAATQIDAVVARFADAPAQVGCLQGILDFYNPRANWLSRAFTMEYASWFRLVLPGLARLGVPIPLGGTTVYFRREVLEEVGGWDAHNVTEDADLGLRLARHGYRTEMLATVTREEANNRLLPWIRQRSRWIKGYMMTWAVHSRRPAALIRDLGARRALAVQVLFLGTILQVLLAPVLWSLWIIPTGLMHPVEPVLGQTALIALVACLLACEAVTLIVGAAALARSPHARLMAWLPTLILYAPLAVLAAYKALWETIRKPFFWDKTAHGASLPDTPAADTAEH